MATTTPNYGWDVPTSTDYVKDGATAIETLGDDIDATLWTALGGAYPGLRLIKKQTIGTGVSSVTVTNAFSATYNNYKIMISGGTASATAEFNLSLGGSTSNYIGAGVYVLYSGSTTPGGFNANTSSFQGGGYLSSSGLATNIELQDPFLAKVTQYRQLASGTNTAGAMVTIAGILNNTNSHTDFTFTCTSGTVTGGTIYVYGYGIS
jgi:hypothetical protein